jgi:hypothetical protein
VGSRATSARTGGERRCGLVAINQGGAETNRSTTLLVGVDCAKDNHQVCVVDSEATIEAERVVEHTGPAIAAFADWIFQLDSGKPETGAFEERVDLCHAASSAA